MSKPYSYHIFMFPFRWDYCEAKDNCKNKKQNFSERTKLEKFQNLLIPNEKDTNWETNKYKTDNSANYNEFTYFYDFVRDAIFDTTEKQEHEKKVMNHYAYKTNDKKYKYEISLKAGNKYSLDIKEIYLHVFTTGVALLSYHLKNNETDKFEDILKINEYGRRIYPQFLDNKEPYTDVTKTKFLADKIMIVKSPLCSEHDNNPQIIAEEDFSKYNDFSNIKDDAFILPDFIEKLLGNNFITKDEKNKIKIIPIIDDRMFVISWYGNSYLINKLQSKDILTEQHRYRGTTTGTTITSEQYNYINNSDWYRYLFIDGSSPMCQNSDMIQNLLQKHSYARFIDWGTLYGVSRYSFVCLTSDLETLKKNDADFIPVHIKTMYYQMIVLSLMQRASILRFSDEVTTISQNPDDNKQLEDIKHINKAYLKFINSMYFREVTAQEQGIELYDMMQEHMRIERDVKDLNREIDELYQYANMIEDKKERERMNRLQIWGAIILIPTLIAGILGMNTHDRDFISFFTGEYDRNYTISVIGILIVALIMFILTRKFIRDIMNKIWNRIKKTWNKIKKIFTKRKNK
ncbi:MAG: CorA family divalent cation transporter [Bacteroidales bacterium]|nr:CorA family divalent cation transporter [Bacteroidales bacterium]